MRRERNESAPLVSPSRHGRAAALAVAPAGSSARAVSRLFVITLVLVSFAPAVAIAQSAGQQTASPPDPLAARVTVGLSAGTATAVSAGLEPGPGFAVAGAFFVHRNVGVEVTVRRQSLDVLGTEANALSAGSLRTTIATANVVGRFAASRGVVPYVTGGMAFFSHTFDVDGSVTEPLAALRFDVNEQIESTVGFDVGGGVDDVVARPFGLFGDIRYFAGSSDTSATLTDGAGGISAALAGDQDINGLAVTGGVRIFF